MSAPARLMRGAVCERIVLERGSILSGVLVISGREFSLSGG